MYSSIAHEMVILSKTYNKLKSFLNNHFDFHFDEIMFQFKRLRLGKTTGWQHRFFDLTILSPIWLGTYEYMKSTLENFFFFWNRASRVDFSDLVKNFQIWPSFCVHQKIIILSILGAGKGYQAFRHYQSRCWKWKNWNGRSCRPKLHRTNFRPKNWRNRPFCIFFLPEPRKTNFCSSETKY